MKAKIFLSCVVLAFSLSSFNTNENCTYKATTVKPAGEYCSIYGITSLTKNGQPVSMDFFQYLFYFCTENNFSLYSHTYTANGTWIDNGKNITINVSVPDPAMDWVGGNWQVIERSEWVLEMEKTENGETWRVRLEGRQR